MNNKDVRWRQRLQNFTAAFAKLEIGVSIASPSDIERQGIIKSYEFTFELAWRTLKDYLESQEVLVAFPREVIKTAFQHALVDDGELWLKMLMDRNLLSHTYNEATANAVYLNIKNTYYDQIKKTLVKLSSKA